MHCISYQAPKSLIKKKKKKKTSSLMHPRTQHIRFQATNQTANRHESSKTLQIRIRHTCHFHRSSLRFYRYLSHQNPSTPLFSQRPRRSDTYQPENPNTKYPMPTKQNLKKKKRKIQNISYYSYKRKINKKSGTLLSPDI